MSRIAEAASRPLSAAAPAAPTTVRPVTKVEPSGEPSPFQRVLQGLGGQLERGERTMDRVTHARGGAEMGTQDLLALQADVYRYSEAVDLSAKLVDRASNGVKTVIQGQ